MVQQHHRQLQLLGDREQGVAIEKLGGGDLQPARQPQNVERGEDDLDVGAAAVEAGDAWMACELEALVRCQLPLVAKNLGNFRFAFGHGIALLRPVRVS